MCDICRQTPCDHRCPNSKEEPEPTYCEECGAPLLRGTTGYALGLGILCETCVDDSAFTVE